MAAPYAQPDYTSMTGSQYPIAIDNAVAAMARIGAAWHVQATEPASLSVRVLAGALWYGATLIEAPAQDLGPVTAPAADPRIDRVVLDAKTGVATIVTGTEASDPSPPAVPGGALPLARIALAVDQTEIVDADITDERVAGGGGLLPVPEASDTGKVPAVNGPGDGYGLVRVPIYEPAEGGAVRLPGPEGWGGSQISATTGQLDDFALDAGASQLALTGAGEADITGFAGGFGGRRLVLLNVSGSVKTLQHLDTDSLEANRISTPEGAPLAVPMFQTVVLQYFGVWRVIGRSATPPAPAGLVVAGTPLVLDPDATATVVTQAHGLGAEPTFFKVVRHCKTGDHGWSSGDRIDWGTAQMHTNGFAAMGSLHISMTATNTRIITASSSPRINHKTSGAMVTPTSGRWRLEITPYLVT